MLTVREHREKALDALAQADRYQLRSEIHAAYLLRANAHATLALTAPEPLAEVVELKAVEPEVEAEKPKRAARTPKKSEAAPAEPTAAPEEETK